MSEALRIAWLTTGRGPGSFGALEYVLREVEAGLPVEIAVVFVNRDRGEAEATDRLIDMAEGHGVAVEAMSSVGYRKAVGGQRSQAGGALPQWRFDYDEQVAERLAKYEFALGVMFGYMLIATPPLFDSNSFINDHPALPDGPVGTYQQVIEELIATRATESGCMMNVVSGEVDRGPVLSFCRYAIRDDANKALWTEADAASGEGVEGSALYADIRARGVARERPFLVETLRAIAAGELAVPPDSPVDLTDAVERVLGRHPGW